MELSRTRLEPFGPPFLTGWRASRKRTLRSFHSSLSPQYASGRATRIVFHDSSSAFSSARPFLADHDFGQRGILAARFGSRHDDRLGTAHHPASFTHGVILSGSLGFRPHRFEGGGMRYLRLTSWLDTVREHAGRLDAVYFQEVRRVAGTGAGHADGDIHAMLTTWTGLMP